ncbi:putative Ribosome biogenesis protein NEP1 [Giardia duodenalis assemblage B]|uniref:Putative Ribosome biogenesis protein NEP1 n=1 Tax=Giardia duodenalis assemblage B TaxID=1394984 RepID=A0A132NUE1_GIAIN|nr:putative Ribosome biogenesis protein NEP1 [Giardia intestinalis assemblage B]
MKIILFRMTDSQGLQPKFDSGTANTSRLIVILEGAFLETVKNKDRYQLLNVDDHFTILRKHKRQADIARPDITHQTLLTLLDSPLNKAGLLEVWIHTENKVLIKIDPTVRIPRTFKRFCGLIVQLLYKLTIRAEDSNRKLLQVVKADLKKHLPPDIRIVLLSRVAGKPQPMKQLATELTGGLSPPDCKPVGVIIGAIAHGHVSADYATDRACISQYALSAAAVAARVCGAFEDLWGIH